MDSKVVEVKKAKNGNGLFVMKSFEKGQTIMQIKGNLISEEDFMNFPKKIRYNCLRFSQTFYLNPQGESGNFINHSCNPNSAVRKTKGKLFLFAIKNIQSNSELLMDYSTIIASDDFWVMKCKCDGKFCRKKISKFNEVPKSIQKRYIEKGIVPEFILGN